LQAQKAGGFECLGETLVLVLVLVVFAKFDGPWVLP